MTDMPAPRRRRRWWIIPLALLVLAGILLFAFRPAIERWTWSLIEPDCCVWDLDAQGTNDIFVVGRNIVHYNGFWWQKTTPPWSDNDDTNRMVENYPYSRLHDVDIWDAWHVYTCGWPGIYSYNGLWWSKMPSAQGLELEPYQLWVQKPDSIYALDRALGLLHWDGSQWHMADLPFDFFVPNDVGGTDDLVVVTAIDQNMAILSDGIWNQIDAQTLLSGIEEPAFSARYDDLKYTLFLDRIWALDDGRVVVGVWQRFRDTMLDWRWCVRLLIYDGERWSTLEPPIENWEPEHIICDDDGYLLVYAFHGDRYRQAVADEGSGLVWHQLDARWPGRILGASVLLNPSELLVYGGLPYTPTGVTDVSYLLTEPYTLERYQLAW